MLWKSNRKDFLIADCQFLHNYKTSRVQMSQSEMHPAALSSFIATIPGILS